MIGELRLVELLAGDDAAVAASLEDVHQHFVREGVEHLDVLALHVRLAGVAEQTGEPRRADARVDDADGERDVVEQRRELAGRAPRRMHAVEHVLAEGGPDHGGHFHRRKALGHGLGPGFPSCGGSTQARRRVTHFYVTNVSVDRQMAGR